MMNSALFRVVWLRDVSERVGKSRLFSQAGTSPDSGYRMQLAVGTTIRRVHNVDSILRRPSTIS